MSQYTDFLELWNSVCDHPEVSVLEFENPYEGFRAAIRELTEYNSEFDGYLSAVAEYETFWNTMEEFGFSHSQQAPVIEKVTVSSAGELSKGMGLVFDTGAVTLNNRCIDPDRIVCVRFGDYE